MYLEHRGNLARGYTFFRGAFDLGDIDRDGADELVIADDEGGFHVYHFTPTGFVPIWISDPILDDGNIVDIKILHDGIPGMRAQVLMLDSAGTLHTIQYNGYLYEETDKIENYRVPGAEGHLVLTNLLGEGCLGCKTVVIALPSNEQIGNSGNSPMIMGPAPFQPVEAVDEWAGMDLYKLSQNGFVKLTENEIARLDEGEIYLVQDFTGEDLKELMSLVEDYGSGNTVEPGESGRAGFADINRDALLDLLVSVSDPSRPVDHLEVYTEGEGGFVVSVTVELPLLNEMVLGDIDGDGFTEIVGLTFDGEILVYQYDPLTVSLDTGLKVAFSAPHEYYEEKVWVTADGFGDLGCNLTITDTSTEIRYRNKSVILDIPSGEIRCGDEIIQSGVPERLYKYRMYFPLLQTLECLGFDVTIDSSGNTVNVESGQ